MRAIVFVILILLVIFPIFGVIPAFGAAASIISAEYTGSTEITIVFDVPVDWSIGNFTGLSHNLTGGSPTVSSIAETSPSSTVTITFDGSAVFPYETGTIEIAAISDAGSGNTFAGAIEKVLSDGQAPALSSSTTTTSTTVIANFTEPLFNVFTASDWKATINSIDYFPTSISPSGLFASVSSVILTFDPIFFADDTPTIEYTPGDLADVSGNALPNDTQVASDGIDPSISEAFVFFTNSITFNLDEPITNNDLTASDFSVSGIASTPTVLAAAVGPQAVTLTLESSITANDTSILLNYAQTSGSLDDPSGNMLQNFSNLSVTNTVPVINYAVTVESTTIDVIFDTDLDGSTVAPSDFTVAGNTVIGATELDGVVTLTLGTPIGTDDTPLVSLVGSVTDVIGFIQNGDSVTPDDGISPIFSNAVTSSPTRIDVIFSEDMLIAGVTPSDFTISLPLIESTIPVTALAVSGDTIQLTLSGTLTDTDTIDVSYAGSFPSPTDTALNPLIDFGAKPVTNNLLPIIIPEGSSQDITVGSGGTGTFSYSETEEVTTETISLGVTLPAGISGTITVATEIEDLLESGTNLVTATDITGPCTNTCTIQFTVPNSILTAAGLTPETVSIYHDINENGLLEADEAITTTRDTTTIPGSTIFTASASFTSAFGAGGKSGSAGASSTGASGSGNDKCDSSAFGRGKSIRVHEIFYDVCEIEKLEVITESYCGPAHLSVLYAGGMTRGGLTTDQPYLDENKVLLTAPISADYDNFRVLVENDKSYYDKLIIPQKLHGLVTECQKTITISHETGYLSNQTISFGNFVAPLSNQTISSDNSTKSQPEKIITQRKTVAIDESSLDDTFFEFENNEVETTNPVYLPEPCVDTWDDSCWESKSSKDNDDELYLLNWFFDLLQSK